MTIFTKRSLLLFVLFTLSTSYLNAQTINFFAPNIDIPDGSNTQPQNVVLSDLDQDGKLDMVVLNQNTSTISIYLNTGSIGSVTYSLVGSPIAVGNYPQGLAVGDLDGDGFPDIVVGNRGVSNAGNTLSIFRNTTSSAGGTISFAASSPLTTGYGPSSVTMGDINGDTKLDLAVTNSADNTVKVFYNTSTLPTISFNPIVGTFPTGTDPFNVAIGDLNNDGHPDLVVANYFSSSVSVFFYNTVTGTFNTLGADLTLGTDASPVSVAINDIDGDTKPDIIVADYTSVKVFRNNGNSTFGNSGAGVSFLTTYRTGGLAVGDLNGDGKPDIAVATANGNSAFSVFQNTITNGTIDLNSFAAESKFVYSNGSNNPVYIVIGDIDGDLKPDLATANNGSSNVSVFRNITANPTWTGGASTSDWGTTGNWSSNLVPGASDNVVIPNITPKPIITSAALANNITVANGTTLTIGSTGSLQSTSGLPINNITVQKALSSKQRGWRLIGNPLTSGVTYANLATGSNIDITYGTSSSTGASAETYSPGVSGADSWPGVNSSASSWSGLSGIALFIRGKSGEGIGADFPQYNFTASSIANGNLPSYVTLAVSGTLNTATANIATIPGSGGSPVYNLIPNPFAAPVSLYSILKDVSNTGFSGTVSYYDPTNGAANIITKGGAYSLYAPNLSSGAAGDGFDYIIPPMGAFIVQSTGGTSLKIPASAIYTGTPSHVAPLGIQTQPVPQRFELSIDAAGIHYDKLAFQLDQTASASLGDKYDFVKIPNTYLDFYSISSDNHRMAFDQRGTNNQTIPLGIHSYKQQNFTLSVSNYTIADSLELVLKDKLLNTVILLKKDSLYSFSITADTATQGNNRFEIVVSRKMNYAVPITDPSLFGDIQMGPNPTSNYIRVVTPNTGKVMTVRVLNMSGQQMTTVNTIGGNTVTIPVNGWSNSVYSVQVISSDGKTLATKKLVKE
jgi:hypothetical protein